MLQRTKAVLKRHPLLAGCTASSMLLGCADTIIQTAVEGKRFNFNSPDLIINLGYLGYPQGPTGSVDTKSLDYVRKFTASAEFTENEQVPETQFEDFDFQRLAKSMAVGFFVMAPNLFLWYRKGLPMILKSKTLSKLSPFKRNLVAMGVDQSVFFTYWSALYLFASGCLFEYCPVKAYDKVKEDLGERLKNNWTYWPAVVLFNLTYIHPLFRGLFLNFFGVWYNVGLAAKRSKQEC